MLGGIGHALVSAVEEAVFFHSIARASQPDFEIKGQNPLTEHYSALGPEITTGPDGESITTTDDKILRKLHDFDAVIIAGQARILPTRISSMVFSEVTSMIQNGKRKNRATPTMNM